MLRGSKQPKTTNKMEMSIEHSFTTLTTMKLRNLRIKRMMKGVVGNNYISIRNIAMNYHDDTLFLFIVGTFIASCKSILGGSSRGTDHPR